jgi:hypothetical protein
MAATEITVRKYVARLSDDEREQLATLIKPQVTQTGLASLWGLINAF